MKNSFGSSVCVTLFGESHGPAIGAVLDGIAPGIELDMNYVNQKMLQRQASGPLSTSRREPDRVQILSGVFKGKTCGTPICLLIENTNTKSTDYDSVKSLMRPGHADYTACCKYHGYQDYRGGGHFSGRITAALVAAGAVAQLALKNKGIKIATHISRCAGIDDRAFDPVSPSAEDMEKLEGPAFPVLDDSAAELMRQAILDAKAKGDSAGGVLETAVTGVPAGLGEPWFDTVEGMLSHMLFSVPAVKGVAFGAGFAVADMPGSLANDAMRVENGRVITESNNAGGVCGGITNAMPIIFSCAVKPTPSIAKPQQTVNIESLENAELSITGRHDPAIIHRARAVIDAVTALCLCDMLSQRYGTDWLGK